MHKFGRRPGDNAPNAIVSLVDGPRDLKFEILARTVGREAAQTGLEDISEWEGLDRKTTREVDQVLKYRGLEGRKSFQEKASDFKVGRLD